MKIFFAKTKTQQNKKIKKKKPPTARVEPGTNDVENRRVIYCATTANVDEMCQINYVFAHEFLPVECYL